jgi:hypothetical protein
MVGWSLAQLVTFNMMFAHALHVYASVIGSKITKL